VAKDRAIGNQLRALRNNLGLTQQEFAEKLGITRLSVARYEAGRVPRLSVLRQIARLGGSTVGSLVGLDTDARSSPPPTDTSTPEIPMSLVRLLRRLKRQIAVINALPSSVARQFYEERGKLILSRAIRDLSEYRALAEGQVRRRQRMKRRHR